MKVAVTGASGFVGRHVVRSLARLPQVTVIPVSRSVEAVEGVDAVAIDMDGSCDGLMERLGHPDAVIHLAWGGLPNYRSLHHIAEELPRQFRFLIALAGQGLKRLVGVGTCFEYGMAGGLLVEAMPTSPTNPYALAKDSLRRQLEMALAGSGCALLWARLFYLYGEGQAPTSLYSQVLTAARSRAATFPMSGGEQLRDFLAIETAADRLAALVLATEVTGILNISSGLPRSVRGLVEGWFAEHGHMPRLDFGFYPYPEYEPFAFWGSTRIFDALSLSKSG